LVLHFYDVEGVLVRRWVPAQRRLTMEGWSGDGWAPYPNADNVSRRGVRLSEEQALALLHESRRRAGALVPLCEQEAKAALSARLRRA
jgi:hypothetical protein